MCLSQPRIVSNNSLYPRTNSSPINFHQTQHSPAENPSTTLASSFLETKESTEAKTKFLPGLLGGGENLPSVKIQVNSALWNSDPVID